MLMMLRYSVEPCDKERRLFLAASKKTVLKVNGGMKN